ncbi:P44-new outer membrane protein [Anaplasma phagocytophilum str. CRT38]|uniref:p44-new outer membrane protein n=1 Tax=Anaplasma phagocytophilum str. CRT38 TaxID=1269275 RepID=S6GBK5_ANAPH|nr:P44-new outer membrane protein [Anaplasma phagocytophilum str. CRT38]
MVVRKMMLIQYLLAKELAYDVVTGQTDNLAAALAKTSGKDFVQFAKAVEISHSDIGKKVCVTKKGASSQKGSHGVYAGATDRSADTKNETALCGGKGGTASGGSQTPAQNEPQVLKNFIKATLDNGSKNWPTSTDKDKAGTDRPEEKPVTNDNAKAVAGDLTKLTTEEKTIVAGLLAKTIEGGEVVEIRAVSSTSVMVNACYDLLSEGLGVVPYACVGLGGNFVGVVDGHITPKLAYRLKAGLSYQLSPEISAFAGGFYHRVVGDGIYDDLPAQLL